MGEAKESDWNDDYQALCKAVGFIVVNWAIMEQSLDGCVSLVFHEYAGKARRKNLPGPLSAKLEFLTDCFSTIPKLSGHKDRALTLFSRIESVASRRHDLVHGAITDVTAKDGVFYFAKLDYQKQAYRVRDVHLDLRRFDELAESVLDLGSEVAQLGMDLHEGM